VAGHLSRTVGAVAPGEAEDEGGVAGDEAG
jgi:hypothetical protein